MRRLALTCSILSSLLAAGCAPLSTTDTGEPASESKDSIVYGTSDAAHTAVVALLIPQGGGYLASCTGTIVKKSGTTAYVLTAAHCCNDAAPTIAVLASNYANYEQWVFGGNPPAPAYKVDANSVYYDSAYNGYNHDFCMLKVPGVPTSTPVIPVAQPGNDGVQNNTVLQLNDSLEHVGYGQTEQDVVNESNPNWNPNTSRRHGMNTANVTVNSTIIQYSQGGSQNKPGPCHGDSGGPALVPAGAAQGSQKVVGVTSYGTGSGQCIGSGAEGVSVRVTSVTGTGGFVTNYLNDSPSGTKAGTAPQSCGLSTQDPACTTCLDTSCCSQSSACVQNAGCSACLVANPPASCNTNALYNSLLQCVNTACNAPCGGGGAACGFEVSNATCNTCMESSCCSTAQACANNTTCYNCLGNPTTACNNNTQYKNLFACLGNNCSTQCGIPASSSSSSSSSGSTSSSSSSSSSGSASSSSGSASSSASSSGSTNTGGAGTGGAGPTGGAAPTGGAGPTGGAPAGTGAGSSNGNDPDQDGGCNVAPAGTGSDTGSNGSLAALLLGAAIAFVRRRKAA